MKIIYANNGQATLDDVESLLRSVEACAVKFYQMIRRNENNMFWRSVSSPLPGINRPILEIQEKMKDPIEKIATLMRRKSSLSGTEPPNSKDVCELIIDRVEAFDSTHLPRLLSIAKSVLN